MDALDARQISGGTVYPTIRVASHPGKLLMGVFDAADANVPDTVLNRRAGEQGAPVPRDLLPPPVPAAEPEAIYAGPLYFHFGHFLLESLARSWYARQHPELPMVWAGAHNWQTASLKDWQLQILEVLGITQPTRIIADPTRFDTLHVPDIGYRYDDVFHPEHAAFLATHDGPAQDGTRLWLSRNKLSTEWRDLNAGPTERHLATAGWTVINPERLTIREQLDHLSRAEVVAGEEGSAFHLIVLLRDVSTKRLEILRRHGPEHRNMHTVGDARNVQQRFHSLSKEIVLEATGRYVSKLNPSSSEIMDILEVPVQTTPTPSTYTDPDIDGLLGELAPDRVLAVGHTHLPDGVRCATAAVAVSPRFDFDPRSYADDPVQFFELDLTQYAEHFYDQLPFDVVWICTEDFEQYMRLLDLSKALAAEQTIWILGSGRLAARCALAIESTYAGYTVERQLVGTTTVLTARRKPGEPRGVADIAALSNKQVALRLDQALSPPLQRLSGKSRQMVRRALPPRVEKRLRQLARR